MTPNVPNPSGSPLYGETNAFWELKLASSPALVAAYARQKADEYLGQAREAIATTAPSDVAYEPVRALLDMAQRELEAGQRHEDGAAHAETGDSIYEWATATRAYTRAQVRALQVSQSLASPTKHAARIGWEVGL
jgi:hypothetical protein